MRKHFTFGKCFPFFVIMLVLNGAYAVSNERMEQLIDKLFVNVESDRSEQDYVELLRLLKSSAEAGNQRAKFYLSMYYANGLGGVERNEKYAYELMESLANEGYPSAQYTMGHELEYGVLNGKIDLQQAFYWYRKSAESGNWLARKRLEKAYQNGELGLGVDSVEARKWAGRK